MLIEVRNLQLIDSPEKKRAFRNLLNAHGNGFHRIVFEQPPEVVAENEFEFLGEFELQAIASINQGFTEKQLFLDEVLFYVCVDFSVRNESMRYEEAASAFNVCYSFFTFVEMTHPTILALEDSTDFDLYKYIAQTFCSFLTRQPEQLKFDIRHGGGSRVVNIYNSAIENKNFVFCIVDADISHPEQGYGSTASRFHTNLHDTIKKTGFVYPLKQHEIENLIPLSILSEVVHNDYRDKTSLIDFLERAVEVDSRIKDFLDLKDGMTIEKAVDLDKRYSPFWMTEQILPLLRSDRCRGCVRETNGSDLNCERLEPCWLTPSLNSSLLEKAVEKLNDRSSRKVMQSMTAEEKSSWEQIAKHLLTWGLSTTRLVSS